MSRRYFVGMTSKIQTWALQAQLGAGKVDFAYLLRLYEQLWSSCSCQKAFMHYACTENGGDAHCRGGVTQVFQQFGLA